MVGVARGLRGAGLGWLGCRMWMLLLKPCGGLRMMSLRRLGGGCMACQSFDIGVVSCLEIGRKKNPEMVCRRDMTEIGGGGDCGE